MLIYLSIKFYVFFLYYVCYLQHFIKHFAEAKNCFRRVYQCELHCTELGLNENRPVLNKMQFESSQVELRSVNGKRGRSGQPRALSTYGRLCGPFMQFCASITRISIGVLAGNWIKWRLCPDCYDSRGGASETK